MQVQQVAVHVPFWDDESDRTLVLTLQSCKASGKGQSNSSFQAVQWAQAEQALAGSESRTGGLQKVALKCQTRWGTVGLVLFGWC
jgi:hypothetical protein